MRAGGGGYLGEVRNAEDLTLRADLAHFFADRSGGFATDVGIDFIEDQDRDGILSGENRLEREHDACEFAGGSDGAKWAGGFSGVRRKKEFDRVKTGRMESIEGFIARGGGELDVEGALFEAEVGELFGDGFAEFGDDFATGSAEVRAGFPEIVFEFAEFEVKTFEFSVARFEGLEFGAGFVAELDYFVECRAIFALEGLDNVDALFEFVEAGGIDLDRVGVVAEFALEIVDVADELGVELSDILCAGIESGKFLERTANRTGLSEDARFIFGQASERGLDQLDKTRGVAGAGVIRFHLRFFAGNEFCAGDFLYLEAEQVELLRVSAFVDDQLAFLAEQVGAAGNFLGEGGARFGEFAISVENIELLGGVEERLMIVGAVHIDEHFAERSKNRERGGRAVDELTIRAGGSEGALEDELMIFAGFETVFVEEGGEGGKLFGGEDRFNRAAIRAAADERSIGAFAEDEVERANDDRLAGAGFAGDGVVAGGEIQGEVRDEGEVLDAERGQHGRIKAKAGRAEKKRVGKKE